MPWLECLARAAWAPVLAEASDPRAAEAASLPLSEATRANLKAMGISVTGQEERV